MLGVPETTVGFRRGDGRQRVRACRGVSRTRVALLVHVLAPRDALSLTRFTRVSNPCARCLPTPFGSARPLLKGLESAWRAEMPHKLGHKKSTIFYKPLFHKLFTILKL